jgi:hypothetical protein
VPFNAFPAFAGAFFLRVMVGSAAARSQRSEGDGIRIGSAAMTNPEIAYSTCNAEAYLENS